MPSSHFPARIMQEVSPPQAPPPRAMPAAMPQAATPPGPATGGRDQGDAQKSTCLYNQSNPIGYAWQAMSHVSGRALAEAFHLAIGSDRRSLLPSESFAFHTFPLSQPLLSLTFSQPLLLLSQPLLSQPGALHKWGAGRYTHEIEHSHSPSTSVFLRSPPGLSPLCLHARSRFQ